MANVEKYSNSNWEGMLKRWSVDKGRTYDLPSSSRNVYDNPAMSGGPHYCSNPQWRGEAQKCFAIHEPPKYYDIADRIYDISGNIMIRYEDEEDEDEDEDEEEEDDDEDDKAETDDKGEGDDEAEGADKAETDDKGEGNEEEEEEEELRKMKEDEERKMKEDEERMMKLKEDLLEELKAYAEFINVANLLHSDGRLYPFLRHVLRNKHDGIRAKGAELVTTMVQYNPTSQQLVMDVNGRQLLLHSFFSSDPDATSRTKTLGAISALIRNNEPGVTAFWENGYAALRDALSSESVGLQRDALNLIRYLLHENCLDCNIVSELKLSCIWMQLASSDHAEVREAALVLLGNDINFVSEKKEDPIVPGFGSPSAATCTVQSNSNSKKRKRKKLC